MRVIFQQAAEKSLRQCHPDPADAGERIWFLFVFNKKQQVPLPHAGSA
jgi:hypothetical protein